MTHDDAERLARKLMPSLGNGYHGNALSPVDELRALCNHILSGDLKREIENAAYVRAIRAICAAPAELYPDKATKEQIIEAVKKMAAVDAAGYFHERALHTALEWHDLRTIRALIQPPAQKENGE